MRLDYQRAAHYFEKASVLAPDDFKLREELALAQVAAGEPHEAIKTIKRLLVEPEMKDRLDLRRALAAAYEADNQLDEAKKAYLDLTRIERRNADNWVSLSELSWKAGDLQGTLHAANRAINLSPRDHQGYLLAGMVWQKRDKLDQALTMFDRAAELAPDQAIPMIMRGISLQKAGRLGAAAEAYALALERDPQDRRARTLLRQVTEVKTP